MTNDGSLEITLQGDREIRMRRAFAGPRRLVFDAWTKPELLKRWNYGPDGWELVECSIDLRAGGTLRYLWRGPDGSEMRLSGEYREVVVPERLVHTEVFDDNWTGGETTVTTVMEESAGSTTVTTTMLFVSQEARDAARASGMEHGVSAGYDRLEQMLALME